MTTKEIELVKNTWAIVSRLDAVATGNLFYNRLFVIAPKVKPLFTKPMEEQSRKLISMITYIVNKLDKLDNIIDEAGKLARRHVQYGVEPGHYLIVGDALLWTLEQGLDNKWTEEVREAWIKCYTILSQAMIEAAYYTPLAKVA
ncbi:MAG TPA: globin family protein [Segetibacter sp.]